MKRRKKGIDDKIIDFTAYISSIVRNVLTAGDWVEAKFVKYTSTFIIIVLLSAILLMRDTFTRNVYREMLEAQEKLKSVEAYYIESKSRFKSETLNSKIMEKVQQRGIDLYQSGNPPILIN